MELLSLVLSVVVHADGIMPRAEHDRTLVPTAVTSTIDGSDVTVTVDAAAPWTTPEPVEMGSPDKLWDNMYGRKVLEVKKHKEIRFAGSVTTDENTIVADGALTIKDNTRPITFRLASTDGTTFKGRETILLEDFGIKKFRALLGAIWLGPEADILVEAKVQP